MTNKTNAAATYHISTDACSVDIAATSADAAVAEFARSEGIRGVSTVASLESHLERVGGYGYVEDATGRRLMDVAS